MLWAHRPLAEVVDRIPRGDLRHLFVGDDVDLRDFARGPESVEEVDERDLGLEGADVRHHREVHGFLHRCRSQKAESGLPRRHDVGVVAEDRQGVRGEGAGRDVEDRRKQFAGDLVHVRNHQEQALRCGERRGQRAGRQGAVHRAGGAGLGLHLGHLKGLAEEILAAVGGPRIGDLPHRRAWSDRVNRGHIAECIRYVRSGGVAVDGHHLRFPFGHRASSLSALVHRIYRTVRT